MENAHGRQTTSSRRQLNLGHFVHCIDARHDFWWTEIAVSKGNTLSYGGYFRAYLARHAPMIQVLILPTISLVFRLDALALSIIATATWLGGWLGGCHTPVLYQNR